MSVKKSTYVVELFPALSVDQCFEKATSLISSSRKSQFLHCKYLAAAHERIEKYGEHGDLKKWYEKMRLCDREVQRRVKVGWKLREFKCDHVVGFHLSHLKRIAVLPIEVARAIIRSQMKLTCLELDYLSTHLEQKPYEQMKPHAIIENLKETISIRSTERETISEGKRNKKKIKKQDPGKWLCMQFEQRANAELLRLEQLWTSADELESWAHENEITLDQYLKLNSTFNRVTFDKSISELVTKILNLLRNGGYDGDCDYVESTSRNGRATSWLHF